MRGSDAWVKNGDFLKINNVQIGRSEEHTSELQSHSATSYAVFSLKKKKKSNVHNLLAMCHVHKPLLSPALILTYSDTAHTTILRSLTIIASTATV